MHRMVNKVIVLGGGSAGFMAALAMKVKLPELRVLVVRSPDIGVIGVGEGSTVPLTRFLHGYLSISPAMFFRFAQPTWKLGLRFLWGPRPSFFYTFGPEQPHARVAPLTRSIGFYSEADEHHHYDLACELMAHGKAFERGRDGEPAFPAHYAFAYHFENERFVDFLERAAASVGVEIVADTVEHVRRDERGVAGLVLQSGGTEAADLYVDSSGFASVLLGKALGEPFDSFGSSLFCDRAVVGGWERPAGDPIRPYTTCETMPAGWAWQIEHERRVNRGYVYSSAFVGDDEAEREFRSVAPDVGPARVVHFRTGRYERAWVGNVVAIGNSAGFVEPLEATSLGVIADECDTLATSLRESDFRPTPTIADQYNRRNARKWDHIRHFLGVHYKFNTRPDTPFWRACRETCDLGRARELVDYYVENGPGTAHRTTLLDGLNQFGLEGYWTLLLGQRVPRKDPHVPSDSERATWRRIQEGMSGKGKQGLDIPEALKVIRSPAFKWPPNLYTPASFAQPVI